MVQKVHEVMTRETVTITPEDSLAQAAKMMRDRDIGNVVVVDGGKLMGILTDRDIVVRAAADGRDLTATTVGEVYSGDVVDISMNEDADRAVQLMRARSIRRVPVTDRGNLVGVLSLSDMAIERDASSALADISVATPNR